MSDAVYCTWKRLGTGVPRGLQSRPRQVIAAESGGFDSRTFPFFLCICLGISSELNMFSKEKS